jgi:hypothetical protein
VITLPYDMNQTRVGTSLNNGSRYTCSVGEVSGTLNAICIYLIFPMRQLSIVN